MSYMVKEIFGPTIQGEGAMAGIPCIFIRLSGCNMWDGRPETKPNSACPYCDTDFRGGQRMTAQEIVEKVESLHDGQINWVWISGGEPLLQLKDDLLDLLGGVYLYKIAVETNGATKQKFTTHKVDHISMSPKVPIDQIKLKKAHSTKVLFPHPSPNMEPSQFALKQFGKLFIQPCLDSEENATEKAMEYVLGSALDWRLSLQTHKILEIE